MPFDALNAFRRRAIESAQIKTANLPKQRGEKLGQEINDIRLLETSAHLVPGDIPPGIGTTGKASHRMAHDPRR